MGVIWAKFRKEKSTQEVLEALQENIEALETYTVNTQEQKKRFVGNFLAISIGIYVISFILFYFIYFPSTWKERIFYFTPLLLFPLIIIFLRYLFTWYFQRKLNKNSKKLTALRAEKKKILEQVMDKETYKVAVNLLARFADKPNKTTIALSSSTPIKPMQSQINRTLPAASGAQRSTALSLSSTPTPRKLNSNYLTPNTPRLTTQIGNVSPLNPLTPHSGLNQQLRRRTPFPIVNQQDKGVFERIVDVLVGDGPQDRFAMICKECYSHNGMALKEDFEYTTFKCAFCSALNPARKSRPVAPRLSTMPTIATSVGSDSSDSEDDKDDSDEEQTRNLNANLTQVSTPTNITNPSLNRVIDETSSDADESYQEKPKSQPQNDELSEERKETSDLKTASDDLLEQIEKSDSAIEDTTMSPE